MLLLGTEWLETLPTQRLLKLRMPMLWHDEITVHKITRQQVLDELNTRPHIPNKAEAKIIRQQRAKAGSRKNHKKS